MTTETLAPLKLDLGAGTGRVAEGYTTVDLYAPEADVQADLGELPYPDDSVTEIWASHCLEHIAPERVPAVLAEWLRVLAPNGPAIISVPNLDYAARYWLHGEDRKVALSLIFGDPGAEGAVHRTGWSPRSLRDELERAGFSVVKVDVIFETAETAVGSFWHECETIRAEVVKPAGLLN